MPRKYTENLMMQGFRKGFWKICRRGNPHMSRALSQSIFEKLLKRTDTQQQQALIQVGNNQISSPSLETESAAERGIQAMSVEPVDASGPRPMLVRCHTKSDTGLLKDHAPPAQVPADAKGVEVFFDEHWWEDFTSVRPMMVAVNDGIKPCGAIMPTADMIERMIAAAKGSRELARKEHQAGQSKSKLLRQSRELESKIATMQVQLRNLKKQSQRMDIDEEEVSIAKDPQTAVTDAQGAIELEIDQIQEHLQRLKDARKTIDNRLNIVKLSLANELRSQRALEVVVHGFVDYVLTRCNILSPENEADTDVQLDPEVELDNGVQLDPEDDIDALLAEQPGTAGIDHTASERERNELPDQLPMTFESQLYEDLENARFDVSNVQHQFDNREAYYEANFRDYLAAATRGEDVMSREEFDLLHLKAAQELTRKLIDAEERYAEFKAKAREARLLGYSPGLDFGSEFSGDCLDHGYGYRGGLGEDTQQPEEANWSGIEQWVNSVAAENGRKEAPLEVDDWEARLPVQMSDSVSCVAEGYERKYIDHWRKEALARHG